MRTVLIVIALFLSQCVRGQSVQVIEDSIAFYLSKIHEYSLYYGEYRERKDETLDKYNKALRGYLGVSLETQPLTLEAGFEKMGKLMNIASSEDKRFRIYSWDEQSGGSMHGFNSVFQFKSGKKVCSLINNGDTSEGGHPGYFYSHVHNISSNDGKTYYVVIRRGIYSGALSSVGVQCFSIEGTHLNDSVKLFRTKHEQLNSIDVEIDFTSLSKMEKNPDIHLSTDNKTLYIPLITDKKVTERYLVYKFNGTQYVYETVK